MIVVNTMRLMKSVNKLFRNFICRENRDECDLQCESCFAKGIEEYLKDTSRNVKHLSELLKTDKRVQSRYDQEVDKETRLKRLLIKYEKENKIR